MKWNNTHLHDLANAKEAARLSELVYSLGDDGKGYDILWRDDKTDTEAYGWVSDDQIVICFRGTSSAADAKTDLKFHKVPFSIADSGDTGAFSIADIKRTNQGNVHRGFLSAVGSVWREIRAWLKTGWKGQPLFVCGHSLGAANACVLAARLSLDFIPVKAVYTFGCPRVGDRKFSRLFNEQVRHYRYVNNNDVVTRLPPFATHTGFRYYFNRRGERVVIGWWAEKWDRLMGRMFQSVVDGVNDHKMSNYIANMK